MKKQILTLVMIGSFAAQSAGAIYTGYTREIFDMYPEAHAEVNPYCDIHTQLILKEFANKVLRVTSQDRLRGNCIPFLPIDETIRDYKIVFQKKSGCGSMMYKGIYESKNGPHTIVVIDHTTRVCKDIVPAKIMVRETDEVGNVKELYSNDRAVYFQPASNGGIMAGEHAR